MFSFFQTQPQHNILILLGVIFIAIWFLFSLSFVKIANGLSSWVHKKSLNGDWIGLGLGMIMPLLLFGAIISLIYSGPLVILTIVPLVILFVTIFLALISLPILVSGLISEFMLKNKHYFSTINIFLALLFLIAVSAVPYVGVLFLYLIFSYTFGIVLRYYWTHLNHY